MSDATFSINVNQDHPYRMKINLNVLNHLGLNLYSNIPAVLSEVVANAWDADAERVEITIDPKKDEIVISDDGVGMNRDDINDKYLTVGYEKRKDDKNPFARITPRGRAPMGRKGIGKLSVFSIARYVEVHSLKEGERNSLSMRPEDIETSIRNETPYYPSPISTKDVQLLGGDHGTKIVLKNLKKRIDVAESALRKRVARRFSHLDNPPVQGDGQRQDDVFTVSINGQPVSITDKDFFRKVEFVWYFGDESQVYADKCRNATTKTKISAEVNRDKGYTISGWIGTVDEQKDFDENDNTIVLFARRKLIQEDILRDFRVAGVYSKYIVGEINAEFMDDDDEPDLVTSDRQRVKEDDDRYDELKAFVKEQVISKIHSQWGRLRQGIGVERALRNDAVKEWFSSLEGDSRKYAEQMFGRIERLKIGDRAVKAELYKASVIAFETLAVRNSLSSLEHFETEKDFELLSKVFGTLDELEAVRYYQIVKERLAVIKTFRDIVPEAKERVLQQHIFDNLWLLHPSWERAATNERIEERVATEFGKVSATLSEEEREGRIDIRYKTAAGKHIIVELKKYNVRPQATVLAMQVQKYKSALEKVLTEDFQRANPHIEIICILGKRPSPKEREEENSRVLAAVGARYITYDVLIEEAINSYSDYLASHKRIKKVLDVVERMADEINADVEPLPDNRPAPEAARAE
jgi:hypothetical protein